MRDVPPPPRNDVVRHVQSDAEGGPFSTIFFFLHFHMRVLCSAVLGMRLIPTVCNVEGGPFSFIFLYFLMYEYSQENSATTCIYCCSTFHGRGYHAAVLIVAIRAEYGFL